MLDQAVGGAIAVGLAKAYGADAFGPAALNIFFANHIGYLQSSEVEIVARSGRILDAVAAGYGIGYIAPVAVIAAGQLMLGNTLNASTSVATAITFSNPTTATCAAIGALFYGYHALSDDERAKFLSTLEDGLNIGRELIRSLISFVENMLTKLLDAESLKALRKFVAEYAQMFGRTIADISRSIGDRTVLLAHRASTAAFEAASGVGSGVYNGAASAGAVGASVGSSVQEFGATSALWVAEASVAAKQRILTLFAGDPPQESEPDDPR